MLIMICRPCLISALLYQGLCLISHLNINGADRAGLSLVFTFSLSGFPAPWCLSQYSCGYQWVL